MVLGVVITYVRRHLSKTEGGSSRTEDREAFVRRFPCKSLTEPSVLDRLFAAGRARGRSSPRLAVVVCLPVDFPVSLSLSSHTVPMGTPHVHRSRSDFRVRNQNQNTTYGRGIPLTPAVSPDLWLPNPRSLESYVSHVHQYQSLSLITYYTGYYMCELLPQSAMHLLTLARNLQLVCYH